MEEGTSVFILPVDIFLLALGQLINRLANEQCRSPTHQRQCAKTCCYGIQAKQGKTRNLAKGSQSGCGADGREAGDAGGTQCCYGNSNSRPGLGNFLEQSFEAWSPCHQPCLLINPGEVAIKFVDRQGLVSITCASRGGPLSR